MTAKFWNNQGKTCPAFPIPDTLQLRPHHSCWFPLAYLIYYYMLTYQGFQFSTIGMMTSYLLWKKFSVEFMQRFRRFAVSPNRL